MSSTETAEFEEENWDEGEVHPPVKAPRAVVSVAFSRDDFASVSEHARREGMKTSEFIRRAALDRVSGNRSGTAATAISGSVQSSQVSQVSSTSNSANRTDVATDAYTTAFGR